MMTQECIRAIDCTCGITFVPVIGAVRFLLLLDRHPVLLRLGLHHGEQSIEQHSNYAAVVTTFLLDSGGVLTLLCARQEILHIPEEPPGQLSEVGRCNADLPTATTTANVASAPALVWTRMSHNRTMQSGWADATTSEL